MNNKMPMPMPFPLAYLDWCRETKHAKTVEETERRDWIYEFYKSPKWGEKTISGIDFAVAMGEKI